jgi:hypothetical protein
MASPAGITAAALVTSAVTARHRHDRTTAHRHFRRPDPQFDAIRAHPVPQPPGPRLIWKGETEARSAKKIFLSERTVVPPTDGHPSPTRSRAKA